MKQKDEFLAVKNLIETGNIKEFQGIFLYVKKKQLSTAIGGNYYRYLRFIKDPRLMKMEDIYSIARALQVTPRQITDLVHAQIEGKKK